MANKYIQNRSHYGDFKVTEVGRAVRKIRHNRNVDPEELADSIGISRDYFLSFERGHGRLADDHIGVITRKLGFNSLATMMTTAATIPNPIPAKILGPATCRLRLNKGISPEDLADQLGILLRTLNKFESGYEIDRSIISKLPSLLGCASEQDIVDRANNQPQSRWVKIVSQPKGPSLEK